MKCGRVSLVVACTLALMAACSRHDRPSIIGHWKAERATFFSAHLPVGPDIVISNDAIAVPGTEARIQLSGIGEKGDETVLEMPLGVGVSFFFDGPDRMHFTAPLIGNVYYRRVHDAIAARQVPSNGTDVRSAGPVMASAVIATVGAQEDVTKQVVAQPVAQEPHPSLSTLEFDQASLAARQGDQDSAIDHLNEALRHGFRSFEKLDAAQEFASLRADVRYQALLARYR